MNRATYKGKVRDRYSNAVTLFYEYRGQEYMVTDEHNGYSETMAQKHRAEQERIDRMLAMPPCTGENHPEYTGEAEKAFDMWWRYIEEGNARI